MKNRPNLKAEDILIDENFAQPALLETSENIEGTDKSDIQAASQIYSFLTSGKSAFPETEKEQTKSRIKASVRKLKWKRQLVRISAAAAVLVICVLTGIWYSQMNSTSEIVKYAQTLIGAIPDHDTRLILQDGQEVRISKEESQIRYSENGKNITIGTVRKVVQEITYKKPGYNTVIVTYGKRIFVTLSEGTKVWLNSGSKLIYPAIFSENKREVYIDGEAVFEVTHSEVKPFYVKTHDFDVKVLGTVFNVSAYADDKYSSTVLKQGKIELSYKGNAILTKKKLTILPGARAVFDPDKNAFSQQQVNPRDYMSWHDGYLNFSSEKLISILKILTRYYNVEILLQNVRLQNETFSGNLDLKHSPAEVLDIIAQTTPFIYEYENNKFVINPK
jgi:ferric-dicitrate binding protein FerR (iron transport regulator)